MPLTTTCFVFLKKTPDSYIKMKSLNFYIKQDPEWHEAMVSNNIDIFEMFYLEYASYFNLMENLEKMRCLLRILRGLTCDVTIVTRTTTTRLIAGLLPNVKRRKRITLKP
jgi:rhamnose utilization protein RhaD (predicted bifunctional aldolase and dehydrogenase)